MKIKFKGKLLELATENQTLPNGYRTTIEVIRHPGAVVIVPFVDDNRIIILHQFRPVFKKYLFELPAGTLDSGESPWRCAKRELREETGYSAQTWCKLGKIVPVPGYSTEQMTIFQARGLTPQLIAQEPDEVMESHIVNIKKIQQLFMRGQIIDAKTICALVFCGIL